MKPNRDHNTATVQETPTKPSLKGEGAAAPVGSGVQEPPNNVCRRPPLLEDPSQPPGHEAAPTSFSAARRNGYSALAF